MQYKKINKVGILMGGYSSESIISLQSGQTVFKNLLQEKFELYKIHIFKNKWVLINNNQEYLINRHDFTVLLKNKKIKFDIVFNVIHGSPGENGQLQAYFDLINLPYTGCDFYTSALTFNKKYCLQWVKSIGISIAPSYFLNRYETFNIKEILKKISLPCFVKPNCSGSSLGASKVSKENQLQLAIEKAFKQDNEIIIEKFLKGTEITVGIIPYNKSLKSLPITEIISENNFFDYDAKYLGKSKEITPARLSKKMTLKIQEITKKIHYSLKLKGISRSEFIIVNGIPYFLEINTIPGLTSNSLIPQQAKIFGISLKNLFKEILYEKF